MNNPLDRLAEWPKERPYGVLLQRVGSHDYVCDASGRPILYLGRRVLDFDEDAWVSKLDRKPKPDRQEAA